jgi:hypothetical protein
MKHVDGEGTFAVVIPCVLGTFAVHEHTLDHFATLASAGCRHPFRTFLA